MIGTPMDAGDPEAIRKAVERTALRCRTSKDGSLEYERIEMAGWRLGHGFRVPGKLRHQTLPG